MTSLLLVAAFVGGFALRSTVPAVVRTMRARREPVQLFAGRLFPHPLDDGWSVETGRAVYRPHLGSPHIVLSRERVDDANYWTYLRIGNVVVGDGRRADRYLLAIERAARERTLEKALEAIP